MPGRIHWRFIAITLAIVIVLIANVVGLAELVVHRTHGVSWSMRARLAPFVAFTMFESFTATVSETTIWGWVPARPSAGTEDGQWVHLPADAFFPHARGNQSRSLAINLGQRMSDRDTVNPLSKLGERILKRHNRKNPDSSVTRIAYLQKSWPSSIRGFFAESNSPSMQTNGWIVIHQSH